MTTLTTQHGSFTIERMYKAAPHRVFAAWADPVAKRAWFAEGEGWEIHKFELDFREGGTERSHFRFQQSDDLFGNDTTFHDVSPDARIIYTYAMDRNGVRFSVSLAAVELHAHDSGTRMVLTEHGVFLEGGDGVKMRESGWYDLLDKLGQYLDA